MKELEITDHLIDKNLLRQISKQDQRILDQYLKLHKEVRLEYEERYDIVQAVKINANSELKVMLNEIHEEVTSNKFKSKIALLIVALLSIVTIGYWVFQQSSKSLDTKALFAQNFENYDPSIVTRGGEELEAALTNAYSAYINKNYAEVLNYQDAINQINSSSWMLILAISAIEMDDAELALQNLNQLIQDNDIYYIDHAIWYKGLLLLKQGEIQQSKKLFQSIASKPGADHQMEAKKLLEKLN